MPTLVLATRNRHKVEEIRGILGGSFEFKTLDDFPRFPEVVENRGTFAGNAAKKAVEIARVLENASPFAQADEPVYVLADDSGLEVDALNGAPGVHSARFANLETGLPGNAPDSENNRKLLRLLDQAADRPRTARFRCVIALAPVLAEARLASPPCSADCVETLTELFDGTCEGVILPSPKGAHGFGYDPLFQPEGFDLTFAELGSEIKNRISHRARALQKLRARLGNLPPAP